MVNLTIGIDGCQTVAEGDLIASQAEKLLHEKIEFLGRVHIHYHPAEHTCQDEVHEAFPEHMLKLEEGTDHNR